MANLTKAQLIEINKAQQEQLDKLTEMVAALTNSKLPQKQEKTLLDEIPPYATAAQREAYEKLAEQVIAEAMADTVAKAIGRGTVKAFIPVSKRYPNRMPHSVQFTVTFAK